MLLVSPYLKAGCSFLWRTFTFGRSWGVKLGQWKRQVEGCLTSSIDGLIIAEIAYLSIGSEVQKYWKLNCFSLLFLFTQ